MRLEQIDKLMTSIRNQEAAARPRIPETPPAGASTFERPMESEQIAPEIQQTIPPELLSEETVQQAVDEANALVDSLPQRGISFALDHDSGEVIVLVIDKQTHEIVRRLPPEDFLKFMSRVQEVVGLFFDKVV